MSLQGFKIQFPRGLHARRGCMTWMHGHKEGNQTCF